MYYFCFIFQLNDNNICRINRYAFRETSSLRSLSLKNNRLTKLPHDAFNDIQMQMAKFDVAGRLPMIWSRTCHFVWKLGCNVHASKWFFCFEIKMSVWNSYTFFFLLAFWSTSFGVWVPNYITHFTFVERLILS